MCVRASECILREVIIISICENPVFLVGKSPCISRLGRCWPRLGGQSSQARTGGVEKANEKGGYVEGRVREGKWPRFRKTQDTTKHKQTVVWFPSFDRQVYFCYG